MDFVMAHLPAPPARLLDAGCGNGELADKLRHLGYDVTAIDNDLAMASRSVRLADICTYDDAPFDAVIFVLSLHHIHHLDRAVDRASTLHKPSGRLSVDEFAHENANAAIADRFYRAPDTVTAEGSTKADNHIVAAGGQPGVGGHIESGVVVFDVEDLHAGAVGQLPVGEVDGRE